MTDEKLIEEMLLESGLGSVRGGRPTPASVARMKVALSVFEKASQPAEFAEQGTEEPEGEHVFIERYGMHHAKFGGIGGDVTSLGLTREAWKAMGEPGVVAVSVSPVEQGDDDADR